MATMALTVRCSRIAVTFSKGKTSSYDSQVCAFSTRPTSSFFSYNSGRSRRRRKRQQLVAQRRESALEEKVAASPPKEEEDTRSVRQIIFPQPFEHMVVPDDYKMHWPTSLSMWKHALTQSYSQYLATWEGFFASQGFIVQSKDDDVQINAKELQLVAESKRTEVTANAKRNMEFVKEERDKLRNQLREQTGIHTTEDLRRFAGEMMKLASECLKEFMTGYRKGRDDETEKMLTQYFQELDEKVNKPRRRKPKRRILKP